MDYYYIQNEEQQGPVSEQEIIKLFHEGVLTEETLITQSGKTTWLPLKNLLLKTPKKPAPYSTVTTPMGLSIWGCFRRCMKLYCRFDGRGTRKEYWSFQLGLCCSLLIFVVIFTILAFILIGLLANREIDSSLQSVIIETFVTLLTLPFLIPIFSSLWRRLHDAGFSGWIVLLCLAPFGGLIIFILTLVDSNKGDNKYGPSEKYPNEE